jgi:hypothetical protein
METNESRVHSLPDISAGKASMKEPTAGEPQRSRNFAEPSAGGQSRPSASATTSPGREQDIANTSVSGSTEQPKSEKAGKSLSATWSGDVLAKPKPALSSRLDGVWAGEFAARPNNVRVREMIEMQVEGTAVHGQNWLEVWEEGDSEGRVYQKFPLFGGKVEGDTLSFCLHLAHVYAGSDSEKYRQCFTGKIETDRIIFRAMNYIDHPRLVPVEERFVARRISRAPNASLEGSSSLRR